MSDILYLSVKPEVPPTGYWDHTFLKDIFADIDLSKSDRQVVVIPGAYQSDVIPEINARLAEFPKVLVILTSDEERKFNSSALKHPDMVAYSQYANGGRMFPLGYAPHVRDLLKHYGAIKKNLDWSFSGQITHYRRRKMQEVLEMMPREGKTRFTATDGFGKGQHLENYTSELADSKIVPCPTGPCTPDSFRLYEALEAGCIPIADDMSPLTSSRNNYWRAMFTHPAFPTYIDPNELPKIVDKLLADPDSNNKVYAWYINWKYQFKEQLRRDLGIPEEKMCVVMPVSPIPSHPSTTIIEETIRTIRVHTNAPILVTMDGVRPEQEHMRENYREFIRQFLWKCNFEYKDVLPVLFDEHQHQSGMMKVVTQNVNLPLVLYVEHDTPLTPDREIPLEALGERILSGESNLIRFHFEALIPEPHKHLMIGEPENDLLKTTQWSQRPHLASMDYYRSIMDGCFSKDANCFIEDKMHSVLQTQEWDRHKAHIYHPQGDIKRSYNLDGRGTDKKFEAEQIW